MKNGKAPTREQKKIMKAAGLVPEKWLVVKNLPDYLEVVDRASLIRARDKPVVRRLAKERSRVAGGSQKPSKDGKMLCI